MFVIIACKSDYDKYWEMSRNAANAPITELATPEGFRFDMDEDAFNEKLSSLNHCTFTQYETNYSMYYELKTENGIYAVDFGSPKFFDGKLCSYYIIIEGKITSGNLIPISDDDVKEICDHYKAILKDGYKFESLPEYGISFDYYVFAKGNLFIEIQNDTYTDFLLITCENKPIATKVKDDIEVESTSISTMSSTVEVKNSGWDGSVKQVKEYLKYNYLRDPDSYESIEWSEVKRKDDGYYVRHKYRAKNGLGGYVVANQLFHLDFSGNVVDVKDLY